MIKQIITYIFILSLFVFAWDKENKAYISTLDNSQSHTIEFLIDTVYFKSNVDSTLFDSMRTSEEISPLQYDYYIAPGSKNSNIYIYKSKDNNIDHEPTFILIIVSNNETIYSTYFIEIEQSIWYWKNYDGIREINDKTIYIEAVFESIGFALSCVIDFPYNEDGLYDNIKRQIKIKTKLTY